MKNINPYRILWISPVVFALHNFEEWHSLEDWVSKFVKSEYFRQFYITQNIAVTMTLLTLTVALIVWFDYRKRNRITFTLVMLAVGMLLGNSLFHLIQFLVFRRYVPGIITAAFISIPFFTCLSYLFLKNHFITKKHFLVLFAISLITMNPVIVLFLFISTFITR